MKIKIKEYGGPGSGNIGHAGLKDVHGGSLPKGGTSNRALIKEAKPIAPVDEKKSQAINNVIDLVNKIKVTKEYSKRSEIQRQIYQLAQQVDDISLSRKIDRIGDDIDSIRLDKISRGGDYLKELQV